MTNNNRKLAKNTILLYLRMIVILLLNLYMSRAILEVLGQEDFGIYNIIGGIVLLLSFVTNAMASATQRFLNFYMCQNDIKNVSRVFNTSMLAHISLIIFVVVLAETIGLWFFENQLNIPEERMQAARWVYQTTVAASVINIIVIPYRAAIIAEERMDLFSILSILEVVLKLAVVILLSFVAIDHLITYSVLLSIVSVIVFFSHQQLSRIVLPFTRFVFEWHKSLYCEILSFASYHLLGGLAMVGSKQGMNILINIFYNVGLNAAVGIANQVRGAVYGFVSSFQTAFNPQLVKYYASNENEKLQNLLFRASRVSFLLLILIAIPILAFTEFILGIWLVNVPQFTSNFTNLIIVSAFIESLSAPIVTVIGATGRVKYYQILISLILLLNLPISYYLLLNYDYPEAVFIIDILIGIGALAFRFYYLRQYVEVPYNLYFKRVLLPCFCVSLLILPVVIFCKMQTYDVMQNLVGIFLIEVYSICIVCWLGIDNSERKIIKNLKSKIVN